MNLGLICGIGSRTGMLHHQARRDVLSILLLCLPLSIVQAGSTGNLTGIVIDPSGRPVPGAEILVRHATPLVKKTVTTNNEGIYEVPALPVGIYRMQVKARGFRLYTLEALTMNVART